MSSSLGTLGASADILKRGKPPSSALACARSIRREFILEPITRPRFSRQRQSPERPLRGSKVRGLLRFGACVAASCLAGCSFQDFDSLGSEFGVAGAAPLSDGGAAGGSGDAGEGGTAPLPSDGGGGKGEPVAGGAGEGGSTGTNAGGLVNLLSDPGFESGHVGWIGFGSSTILDEPGEGRYASGCIASVNRTQPYEGPTRDLIPLVVSGASYSIQAWVRVSGGTQPVAISLKTVCTDAGETYSQLATASAVAPNWTPLAGSFVAPTCALAEYRVYLEGPAAGVTFYVDDVVLYLIS